jgi:hypothetical protein
MITSNSLSDQGQDRPAPSAPVSDPKAQASNLGTTPDPYEEASRRRELASAGNP